MVVASGLAGPVLAGPTYFPIAHAQDFELQERYISCTPALSLQPRLLALRLRFWRPCILLVSAPDPF